jgi:hypothetical protein
MLVAWADGVRGHEEIMVFGLPPPWARETDRLLLERYGVKVNPVAGCVVTDSLVWYAGGYNSVARARLESRFGKDIFAECANDAQAAWRLAHPAEPRGR